jgi:hypothetical protein
VAIVAIAATPVSNLWAHGFPTEKIRIAPRPLFFNTYPTLRLQQPASVFFFADLDFVLYLAGNGLRHLGHAVLYRPENVSRRRWSFQPCVENESWTV